MGPDTALWSAAALFLAALGTNAVRGLALARGLLDIPNSRSSHTKATPRGGGLAIVLASVLAWAALAWRGVISSHLLIALAGGGAAVAFVGFLDDRRPLPARMRFAIHLAAAGWAIAWVGAPAVLPIGGHDISLGWFGVVLAVLGITWFLNLFNFMDGIDGIAASEAVFMSCAGAVLTSWRGWDAGVAAAGFTLGASCCGFLLFNWPPAKIFMGDVGSGYLGYVLAVMALAATQHNPVAVWVWLILGGIFFVDATVTLVRRTLQGQRVSEGHRSHAYQWLSRRWGSHLRVTLAVAALNILWLLPCAVATVLYPGFAAWLTLVALLPLTGLAVLAGAGLGESA